LDGALTEIADLKNRLKRQRTQSTAPQARASAGDPFDQEMLELLRDEVTQLQGELADRDARLAELAQGVPSDAEALMALPTSEGLLDRLEQLLDELDRKDEHVRSLEELLAGAEEATKAEQEERRQLESWVTDIEQRIGARESEWQATLSCLRRQLEQRTEERDRAESALEEAAADSPTEAHGVHERLVENLRGQVADLESRLAEAERRRGQAPEGGSAAYVQAKIDEALRAERLELARERAALARSQSEFQRAQGAGGDGNGGSPESWSAGLDSSQRIRALRDHLKDVHDEESKHRSARGLSGRIASLWKRLEGRGDGD
jgi:chromosome segregation ATPase